MEMTNRCMIVPAEYADLASTLTAAAAGPAGGGMFVSSLTEPEAAQPTHRFSNGGIEDKFAAILPLDEWDDEAGQYVRVSEGDPGAIAAMGAPLEAVQALLDAVIVTAEQWDVTAARLGLSIAP